MLSHQTQQTASPTAASFETQSSSADQHGVLPSTTLQTLFEYDPTSAHMRWADRTAAARLLGTSNIETYEQLPAYDACIIGNVDAVREQAFQGEVLNYVCEYQLKREDGEPHWVEERGGWIGTGERRRLISVVRSTEGQKRREERLSWLATNDELTGQLNRTALREQLSNALEDCVRRGHKGAYLVAGIDDLGAVNENFGFDAADTVICEVGRRMGDVIGDQNSIGRVAGTKFGIVLNQCNDEELRAMCVQLLNCVRESVVDTSDGGIAASVSLGAIQIPGDASSVNSAMSRAEAALDEAKRMGHSSWSSFSEKTDTVSMRRHNSQISDVILTALNDHRVQLAYQPIVTDLNDPQNKFECLIRMRDEEGCEVAAPDFVPAAERLGLVHLLDRRVLELATQTLHHCPDVLLNVNISMETVKDFVWTESYLSHLRANADVADRITVELTETKVIDGIEESIEFVGELKKLGCKFAIDDFGAGYTSFRNLKALDIDILKIDGSFVTGLANSRENQLFVRTLLDLARNFEMQTVAEWVDNEADALLLKGLGVDFLQGYLIGQPDMRPDWLPAAALEKPAPAQNSSLDRFF